MWCCISVCVLVIQSIYYVRPVDGNVVRIPALGRVHDLGELYNLYTEEFPNSRGIVGNIPGETISETDATLTDVSFKRINSLDEKLESLNLGFESQLSLMAGMINVAGAANYLNVQKVYKESECGILKFTQHTVIERIFTRHEKFLKKLSIGSQMQISATHIVTGILYGAAAVVSFCEDKATASSKSLTFAEVEVNANKFAASLQSKLQYNLSGSSTTNLQNFEVNVYADIRLPPTLPTTMKEVYDMLKYIPQEVRNVNAGKGKPMEYELTPVEEILKLKNASQVCICHFNKATKKPKYGKHIIKFQNTLRKIYETRDSIKQFFLAIMRQCEQYKHIMSDNIPQSLKIMFFMYDEQFKIYNVKFTEALFQSRLKLTKTIRDNFYKDNKNYYIHEFGPRNIIRIFPELDFEVKKKINNYNLITQFNITYLGKNQFADTLPIEHYGKQLIIFYSHNTAKNFSLSAYDALFTNFLHKWPNAIKYFVDCDVNVLGRDNCTKYERPRVNYFNMLMNVQFVL